MKRMICAGNWKMNKGPKAAEEFLKIFLEAVPKEAEADFILFPQNLVLSQVADHLKGRAVGFGAQNCYWEKHGAFTGENSPEVLKELGAGYCLVGHSERRQIFKETDEDMARKVRAVQDLDLLPVLCIGETLDQRTTGKTNAILDVQLSIGLKNLSAGKKFWIAYEPVWAIGTGVVAEVPQVAEAHQFIFKKLQALVGPAASQVKILYGGSVKPDNAKALAKVEHVDGFLIGGASLDPKNFIGCH